MYVSQTDILEYDQHVSDVTKTVFENCKKLLNQEGSEARESQNKSPNKKDSIDKSKVFIVHGHDELAKTEIARFIEKLNLIPIILHEQANSGKTIIEKIEEHSNVGFGVVLYTPCDVGSKKRCREIEKQSTSKCCL